MRASSIIRLFGTLTVALASPPSLLAAGLPTVPISEEPEQPKASDGSKSGEQSTQSQQTTQDIAPPERSTIASTPQWSVAFSNLTAQERADYIKALNRAKEAYQAGQPELCLSLLVACDLIFADNPHAWNLKVRCLLDVCKMQEAQALLDKTRQVLPNESFTLYNTAALLLQQQQYERCIQELKEAKHITEQEGAEAQQDILTYYQLLCHLMLDQVEEARQLVSHLTPMSDTPLYYMSEAAFSMYRGDASQAQAHLNAAASIYGSTGMPSLYGKALGNSGLISKGQAKGTQSR